MQLFNSLTQQVESFDVQDNTVKLYVCGVTPYDTTHLGHTFVFGTFDILIRYLHSQGLSVQYVQNVTDIDDPLFEKALELGNITWDQLAQQETARFVRDMHDVNITIPEGKYFALASDHLPTMFALIEKLLQNGNAYINDGWIYFDVSSDPGFARLAFARGLISYDQLLATATMNGHQAVDLRKRDPLDFLLWRGATADEPSWSSPWGAGRPGWHIECSAMATHLLGPQIDIHGGGADLIFPHHSCEIAQTEQATGMRPYVRYWMHVGIVKMAGLKMSKTEGNLIITHKLLKSYSANAIRLFLAMHHYRQDWEFTFPDMDNAQRLTDSITQAVQGRRSKDVPADDTFTAWTIRAFCNALANDLDTPRAVRVLGNLASACLEGLPEDEIPIARDQIVSMTALLGLHLGQTS